MTTTQSGRNSAAICGPYASSTSRTAMSAETRPKREHCATTAEPKPCGRLPPAGLLNTRTPCSARTELSMAVVVDFPLEPVTKMTPPGIEPRVLESTSGTKRRRTQPGKAEPPPRSRVATRAILETRRAQKSRMLLTRGSREGLETGRGGEASPWSLTQFGEYARG